jgi:hypothetical protein
VLSRRLIASAGAALLLTACAGVDGTERGAIRENVIEPGITAIGQARSETCGINASNLRTAIDAYTLFEGDPPPDEQALVDGGFLRSVTEDWNIVDGELVAENPACGDVPTTVPTQEIVTEANDAGTLAPMTVEEVLATFDEDQVAEVGGPACARQMAVIISGAEQYVANEGVDPETIEDVERAGYLAEPVTMWQVVDDELRPTDDSPCNDFVAADR